MKKKWPFAVLSSTIALTVLMAPVQGTAYAEDHDHDHDHEHAEISATLDTDGDGLFDVTEHMVTSWQKADTDGNGVSDAQEDIDGDGLSNLAEQSRGTNLEAADTDGDRVSDSDEIYKHSTDPLNADSDGDNLSDGVELIEYNLNPLQADQDGDGQLDGMVDREYKLPANAQGISGVMIGIGDLPTRITIRKSPILLVKKLSQHQSFDLESLDKGAVFKINVPVGSDKAKGDLRLFRYVAKSATLELIEDQKVNQKTGQIEATFTGGGSFVVMPMSEYKQNKDFKDKKVFYKGKATKNVKGKVQIAGLPGVMLTAEDITEEGTFQIEETVTYEDGMTEDLSATYQIDEMIVAEDGTAEVDASAITIESGKMPVIMVHGLNANSTTWGYNNYWANGETSPKATTSISSSYTFTGKSYAYGTYSSYSNIDTQYITSASDTAELGYYLDAQGYTRNVDLFTFEYYANGHVGSAGGQLKNFIANLKSAGVIPYGDVNLIGHSKGGLVSRYYIENLTGSTYVARLTTLGTPHFGSDLANFGTDLDRQGSDLWGADNSDSYCAQFNNSHPYTKYFAFGGWKVGTTTLSLTSPSLKGVWSVGKLTGSYDADVRTRFKNAGVTVSWAGYPDIGDTAVNIDSAMGSDKDPDYSGSLATLTFQKRWYIFHDTYGGHSAMRKYSTVQSMVKNIQAGSYDL